VWQLAQTSGSAASDAEAASGEGNVTAAVIPGTVSRPAGRSLFCHRGNKKRPG
jgi:hypothetical protein